MTNWLSKSQTVKAKRSCADRSEAMSVECIAQRKITRFTRNLSWTQRPSTSESRAFAFEIPVLFLINNIGIFQGFLKTYHPFILKEKKYLINRYDVKKSKFRKIFSLLLTFLMLWIKFFLSLNCFSIVLRNCNVSQYSSSFSSFISSCLSHRIV